MCAVAHTLELFVLSAMLCTVSGTVVLNQTDVFRSNLTSPWGTTYFCFRVPTAVQAADHCRGVNWCVARNWKSVTEYVLTAALIMFILSLQHELKGAELVFVPPGG